MKSRPTTVTTVLIMLARLCGATALGLGVAYGAGLAVPLHIHLALGGLLVLALWGLAWRARRAVPRLALAAALWGLLPPLLGMAQLHFAMSDGLPVLRGLHVVAGLGAIALAESLAKRSRT